MTNIIETAKEQFRQCTWWGGAGQALPERYVDELIAEIDRLNKAVEQLRQSNGALTSRVETLKSGQAPDPVKMNLHAEVQRLTGENIELERKAESLQEFKTHYSDLARAITAMAVKARQAMNGDSPGCHHCDDTGDIHAPDGEWRGYCDCAIGIHRKASALISESKAQSLLIHDAEVLEKMASQFRTYRTEEAGSIGAFDYLKIEANRLRAEAHIDSIAAMNCRCTMTPLQAKEKTSE